MRELRTSGADCMDRADLMLYSERRSVVSEQGQVRPPDRIT